MADQELKACPHCGSTPLLHTNDEYVMCEDCSYDLPIGIWQMRAEPVGVPTVQAGDVELTDEQEARYSAAVGFKELTGISRNATRLAMKLNMTGKGLIDYAAATAFAKEWELLRSAAPSQPVAGKPSDEQIDALIKSVCHSDPVTASGEYCLTIDEVRALLTTANAGKEVQAVMGWLYRHKSSKKEDAVFCLSDPTSMLGEGFVITTLYGKESS